MCRAGASPAATQNAVANAAVLDLCSCDPCGRLLAGAGIAATGVIICCVVAAIRVTACVSGRGKPCSYNYCRGKEVAPLLPCSYSYLWETCTCDPCGRLFFSRGKPCSYKCGRRMLLCRIFVGRGKGGSTSGTLQLQMWLRMLLCRIFVAATLAVAY